ncbi:MAG: SDR family oxidoreductase [Opitutales bacterium]|nr:SDR family oxidoreductase [Opitutales bacterium]
MNDSNNIENKVIVITGASSGIGCATSKHLAGLGAKVVLGARRAENLQSIVEEITSKGGQATWKVTDVTDQQSVLALVDHGRETYGPIDVLINNAGINTLGKYEDLQIESWDRMIDVNVKGPLYGIAAVLPEMKERGAGHIISTSSIAAHTILPQMGVYNGTKFAVRSMMEGLRQEVTGYGIRVTTISPGAAYTEIGTDDAQASVDFLMKEFEGLELLDPMDLARGYAYAINQPASVDINDVVIRPTGQQM